MIREVLASGKTVTFAIKHVVARAEHLDDIAEDTDDDDKLDASKMFG